VTIHYYGMCIRSFICRHCILRETPEEDEQA
jgi:hypothetical protein